MAGELVALPTLLDATIEAGNYVTGDIVRVVATFDDVVNVGAAAVFEIEINGTTRHASVAAAQAGETIYFDYLVRADDQAELEEVTLGTLIPSGTFAIYGGSPIGDAVIPDLGEFTADVTEVSINAA